MQSFFDPAILFFVFGILAGSLKSNLEIPPQISRFLSLYLLMALGLKGGFALAQSGMTTEVLISLGAALGMAILVPLLGYLTLRRFLNGFDAAAIAATYGSVSAVTFITAVQYQPWHQLWRPHGGSDGVDGVTGHRAGSGSGQSCAPKNHLCKWAGCKRFKQRTPRAHPA